MEKSDLNVAYYDMHYPQYNKPTLAALFAFLKHRRPKRFIFGGDQFHFDCIAHHNAGKPLYKTRRAYKNDIDGFDRDVLTPLEKLLPKNCEKVWIIGNHERFEFDMIEEHPELEDAVGHQKLLRLEERGWTIIPLGHTYKLGKLNVIHGEILSGIGNQAGMYPSRKAVELYAGSVLAGHTHSPQTFTKISPVEQTNKWQGFIAPCAGDVNPGYLRNRPTAWLTGLVIVETYGNGFFNCYPAITINGKFAYGGYLYGG